MAIKIRGTECCGIKQIHGVHDAGFTPRKMIKAIIDHTGSYEEPYQGKMENMGFAGYVLFFVRTTADGKNDKGLKIRERIADFLSMHDLGALYESPEMPSGLYSGHHFITVCTYVPNHVGIRNYAIKQKWIDGNLLDEYAGTQMCRGIYNWGGATTGVH